MEWVTLLIITAEKFLKWRDMKIKDLKGKKFGRWTALRRSGTRCGQPMWICRCECGIEKAVFRDNLRLGRSRGCRNCGNSRRLPPFRYLYNVLTRVNKRFSERVMTFEQFLSFTGEFNCIYCKKLLVWTPVSGNKGATQAINLDRKNTKKG